MSKERHIVGRHSGVPYTIVYDKLGNQQACDAEHRNLWAWFLTIDGEYMGHFDTKREAIDFYRGEIYQQLRVQS